MKRHQDTHTRSCVNLTPLYDEDKYLRETRSARVRHQKNYSSIAWFFSVMFPLIIPCISSTSAFESFLFSLLHQSITEWNVWQAEQEQEWTREEGGGGLIISHPLSLSFLSCLAMLMMIIMIIVSVSLRSISVLLESQLPLVVSLLFLSPSLYPSLNLILFSLSLTEDWSRDLLLERET